MVAPVDARCPGADGAEGADQVIEGSLADRFSRWPGIGAGEWRSGRDRALRGRIERVSLGDPNTALRKSLVASLGGGAWRLGVHVLGGGRGAFRMGVAVAPPRFLRGDCRRSIPSASFSLDSVAAKPAKYMSQGLMLTASINEHTPLYLQI